MSDPQRPTSELVTHLREINALIHNEAADEIERLLNAIRQWSAPTGSHRNCDCERCQRLRELAMEETSDE